MALFLTISRGRTADRSLPVLVTGDQGVIRLVLDAFRKLDPEEGDAGRSTTTSEAAPAENDEEGAR